MNIYVGNLAREATEEDVKAAFAAFGEVGSVAIIKDKFSGESRGFGFVEMPNKEQAQAAITGMNGKPIKDRPVTVNEARPREDRGGRGDDRGGRGGFGGGGERRGGGGFGGGERRGGGGGGGGGRRSW
jgi:RNA recognition motif-containing protein